MPIVETRQVDTATRNVSNSATKYQEQTATVYNVGLQTMQEMQGLKKACN
jgi:hypothetical protein